MDPKILEKFEKIREKVKPADLVMSRVPDKTKKDFVKLSNDDYSGDYGMTLKGCLDSHFELIKLKKAFDEGRLKIILEELE